MSTKRAMKMLMAEGVQRNDAAAFVRAYHKLKDKPAIKLFPELIVPSVPLVRTQTLYPSQYAVQHVLPKTFMGEGTIDIQRYMKRKLTEKLVEGLVNSGFILFEHKEYANEVIFTAKIRVLPLEATEAHTLGEWG